MSDFGLEKEDLDLIRGVLAPFPSVKEALIFGSRAMGHFKPTSDVDIALKGEIDRNTLTSLHFQLEEDLPLPYFFDLVDYHTIHNPKLKEHIDQYGKVFYIQDPVIQD